MRAPGQEDVELVRRAQRGEREAFAELFNGLHQPVLNYVYHMLGDRQSAEDVTQDAFIRAHEKIGQLGPPWDFKSWVFRIASNLAIDFVRGGRRFVQAEDEDLMGEPPTTRRPLERRVQQEEMRQGIHKTLDALPTTYRQAIILRELNGLSYAEVARALECSYENARQLVHRARLRFRELHGLRLAIAGAGPRCQELGDLLSAYHDGELDRSQRRAVRAHMATCAECRETSQDLKKMGALLVGLPPILPSVAWKARVLEQLGTAPGGANGGAAGGSAGGAGGGAGGGAAPPGWLAGMPGGLTSGGGLALIVGAPVIALVLLLGGMAVLRSRLAPTPAATASAAPTQTPAPTHAATASPTMVALPPAPLEPSRTLLPSATPTPTPTVNLGPPMVTALRDANCRFGPRLVFDVTAYLTEGQTAPIDGRNPERTWWYIRRPDGFGHCWIWGELVSLSGDLSRIPIVPEPPTPTPTPVDNQPPLARIVHIPTGSGQPDTSDVVTFTATASDNLGVARIEIWITDPGTRQPRLARTCLNQVTCVFSGGPYPRGAGAYFAKAWDLAGNLGQSQTMAFTVYLILQ